MDKPKRHILVCTSSRANGMQKGICHTKESTAIVARFLEEIEEQELSGEIMVTNTGCFGICEQGPIVVVYPDNVWYGQVTPDKAAEIVEKHIIGGENRDRTPDWVSRADKG